MASEESSVTGQRIRLSISEITDSLLDSYQRMGIPIRRYLLVILLPAFVFFLVTIAVAVVVQLPFMVRAPIPLLGALAFGTALFYPKVLLSQQRKALNNRLHLFITHMTVLSTTRIDQWRRVLPPGSFVV